MRQRRIVKSPEERRRELITAARELFLERGYEETTMSAIAKRAKVAQGTSYIYFSSKQELLIAIMREMLEAVAEVIRRLAEQTDLPAPLALRRAWSDSLTLVSQESRLVEAVYLKANYSVPSRLLGEVAPMLLPLVTAIIERGVREGSLRASHPRVAADFLWTVGYRMFEVLAQEQIAGRSEGPGLEELQEGFWEFVSQGLGIRATADP